MFPGIMSPQPLLPIHSSGWQTSPKKASSKFFVGGHQLDPGSILFIRSHHILPTLIRSLLNSLCTLSPCLYDRCSNPFNTFMAMHCTHYIISTRIMVLMSQTQDSWCRLTTADTRGRTDLLMTVLLMPPWMLLSFCHNSALLPDVQLNVPVTPW